MRVQMPNENLKNALQNAGLTPDEFADIIRVDPKSVVRWLAGTTKPYPRHRANIARALNLIETDLWPDETSAATPGHGGAERDEVALSEVTRTWAHATDQQAPDLEGLISGTSGAIDLLDSGRGIELTVALVAVLVDQGHAGRKVRVLTSLPRSRLRPLIGHHQIEVRIIGGSAGYSLVKVADTILLTIALATEGGEAPPLLQLEPAVDGGLFDRLAGNFETLWDDADETLSDPQQLDAYLSNTDEDDDYDDQPEPAEEDMPSVPGQIPRRWPRRPD